jgi:lycopene cyclase domain-containing protein
VTYFGFLARFLVIPILVFLIVTWWDNKNNRRTPGFASGRAVWIGILVHVVLAVAYTTPWDNYLVATGVWSYNPNLVTGIVIGYVPLEEYTFFVLETVLAGLGWWFLARKTDTGTDFRADKRMIYQAVGLLTIAWAIFTWLFFFGAKKWTYLGITLFWALPAILPQLLFGADILWHYRKLVALSIVVPGTYLSLVDMAALRETTWSISPAQTTGILFFGILPLEEVVFFFVTSLMITFGMTLMLSEQGQARVRELKARLKNPRRNPDKLAIK